MDMFASGVCVHNCHQQNMFIENRDLHSISIFVSHTHTHSADDYKILSDDAIQLEAASKKNLRSTFN